MSFWIWVGLAIVVLLVVAFVWDRRRGGSWRGYTGGFGQRRVGEEGKSDRLHGDEYWGGGGGGERPPLSERPNAYASPSSAD